MHTFRKATEGVTGNAQECCWEAQKMRTRKTTIAVSLLVIGTYTMLLAGGDKKPVPALKRYASSLLGVQFEYPAKFVIGRYHAPQIPEIPAEMKALGIGAPFKNAVVLVEPRELGTYGTDSIPVGEVATISLELKKGFQAQFTKQNFCQDKFKQKIGTHTVYRLPGFPGPYGENAFYYLIPVDTGIIEIVAHKTFLRQLTQAGQALQGGDPTALARVQKALDSPALTNYDKDIEAIIKTIEMHMEEKTPQPRDPGHEE